MKYGNSIEKNVNILGKNIIVSLERDAGEAGWYLRIDGWSSKRKTGTIRTGHLLPKYINFTLKVNKTLEGFTNVIAMVESKVKKDSPLYVCETIIAERPYFYPWIATKKEEKKSFELPHMGGKVRWGKFIIKAVPPSLIREAEPAKFPFNFEEEDIETPYMNYVRSGFFEFQNLQWGVLGGDSFVALLPEKGVRLVVLQKKVYDYYSSAVVIPPDWGISIRSINTKD